MKRWTRADKRTLRRLAPTHTAEQIAAVVGRTVNAVRQQAHLLGIQLQKFGDQNHSTKYSDALVERIRQMHDDGMAPKAIARETGVPLGSVKSFVYYRLRPTASLTLLATAQQDGPA